MKLLVINPNSSETVTAQIMDSGVAMLDPLPPDIRFEPLLLRPEAAAEAGRRGIFVCRKERGSRPTYLPAPLL